MKTLRIFISSPSDVAEERDRAKQVVESLRRRYAGKFILKPLLWEELPLQPDMSFQQGIDMVLSQDRGLEVAVFILWSRLGTPLGKTIPRPDGSEYRSGTEREFDLMMQARKQSGGQRPHVLVYTRRDETSFDERLRGRTTTEKEDLLSQKKLVEGFIKEEFHDSETGLNRSAYHSFDRPVTFSQRLRTHLQEVLDELAGGSAEVIWDTEKQGPPFMGLEAFQPQHADVFFGREEEVIEARHALREQARNGCAFLLLSGASGSGKSSLARAGILPAICDLELDEQVASWRTLIVTPTDLAPDPFLALVTRFADILPALRGEAQNPALHQLAADLRENPGITLRQAILPAIARASTPAKGPVRLLLLIDQLEEFFASTASCAGDRAAFFSIIESLACCGSVWVLATVRSDFYQQVQSEPSLVRLKSGHGQLDILPPGPDALRRLIEEPARLAGLTFETRDGQSLADRILRDAAAHAELLPLLEFVLRELYEQRTANGQLTFAAYETLGGVEGALASRAEHAFRSLPGDSQQALATVLQSLVTLGNDTDSPASAEGGGERLVRQRTSLSAFAENPAAHRFVDAFIAERLFTGSAVVSGASPPASHGADVVPGGTVTVAHESLLRVWPRALQWADQNREFLRTRARIAARMKEGSPLLEGDPLLTAAQAHLHLQSTAFTPAQRDYIQASTAAAAAKSRRTIRHRRMAFAALTTLTLFSAVAAFWARTKQSEALEANARTETALITKGEALLQSQRDLERSILEEGRAWLERARAAKEKGNHLNALMLAGRAVGFQGCGHRADGSTGSAGPYPLLLGGRMKDEVLEEKRRLEAAAVEEFMGSIRPTFLPVWSSPARIHDADTVFSVAFSPAGTRLAGGSSGKTVKVWDAATGKETATLSGHSDSVTDVAFSPDGSRIASGSEDKTVKVWDTASRKELATLSGHSSPVTDVAFSPDGSRIASGSQDDTVKVWDVASGKELFTLSGHSSSVWSVAFSPDGSRIASGSLDNTVKVWDAARGKELATLSGHSGSVQNVTFSPDGTSLASGSGDQTVKVWDVASRKELATLSGHSIFGSSLAFSPDGSRLATGSKDDTVKVWDAASRKELVTLSGHSGSVASVAFSPDGSRLVSGGGGIWDKTVKVWDAASGKELASLSGHYGSVWSVAFSPAGNRLASGSLDKTVKVWDAASGKELLTLFGHSGYVTSVAFSPDGSRLASGSWDTTVKVWDSANGKEVASLPGHSWYVTSVAFSPDGSRIASGSADKTVKVWDAATGKELATLSGHPGSVTSVAFSSDGKRVAGWSSDRTVKVWDSASGKELVKCPDIPVDEITGKNGVSAVIDDSVVRLVPTRPTMDLLGLEREGYLNIDGKEIVWRTGRLAQKSCEFRPVQPRQDLLAQLANLNLTPAQRMVLRVQLCAKGGSWRPLPPMWQEAKDAGLVKDAEVRRVLLRHYAIAARGLAVATKPSFPTDLWQILAEQLQSGDFTDISLAAPLSQAWPALAKTTDPQAPLLRQPMEAALRRAAPPEWQKAVMDQ